MTWSPSATLYTFPAGGAPLAAELIGTLALACRDQEGIPFRYRARDGVRLGGSRLLAEIARASRRPEAAARAGSRAEGATV